MTAKKAILLPSNLPPVNAENKYAYRYRIVSEDRNRTSSWSPIKTIDAPEVIQLDKEDDGNVSISGNSITATWSDENNRPRYDVFARFYFEISKASLTDNIATIHTTIDHNIVAGDKIIVSGVGAPFDTDSQNHHTVTLVTADTISFAKTNANIPQFNINPHGYAGMDYFYHGTTPIHAYSFIKRPGTKLDVAIQVEGIFIDGTKPFYGTAPFDPETGMGNKLLVYLNDNNTI